MFWPLKFCTGEGVVREPSVLAVVNVGADTEMFDQINCGTHPITDRFANLSGWTSHVPGRPNTGQISAPMGIAIEGDLMSGEAASVCA